MRLTFLTMAGTAFASVVVCSPASQARICLARFRIFAGHPLSSLNWLHFFASMLDRTAKGEENVALFPAGGGNFGENFVH